MKRYLVDFIGMSGAGKSTLLPLVANRLNAPDKMGANGCAIAGDVGYSRSYHIVALCRYLKLVCYWKLIVQNSRINLPIHKRWILLLARHAWHRGGSPWRTQLKSWLFDEGLVVQLSKHRVPLSDKFLSICPLPHMVVNVQVNLCQAIMRKIHRSKPAYQMRRGSARKPKAEALAKILMTEYNARDVRMYLNEWSIRYCAPPLSSEDICDVVNKAEVEGHPAWTADCQNRDWVRPALERLGVAWIDVDTSGENTPEQVSEMIAEAICERFHAWNT